MGALRRVGLCVVSSLATVVAALAVDIEVPFVANEGQTHGDVAFLARTFAGTVFVTARGEVVYSLPVSGREGAGVGLRERVVGCRDLVPQGVVESATRVNCFRGNDPSDWRSDVSAFDRISIGEVRPGVELDLVAHGDNVEKILTARPFADVETVRFVIEGGETLALAANGELVVATRHGPIRFTRPVAFQDHPHGRASVDVRYVVDGNRYGFDVGEYDPTLPLVVDPLLGATYLGGNSNDRPYAVALAEGDAYVVGETKSSNFPVTPGAYDTVNSMGSSEAFVARLNGDLTGVVAATYLGGSNSDDARAVAVVGDHVYVTGRTTSTNFPVTPGAYQSIHNGGIYDVFVSKLTKDLTTLVASTLIGGAGSDSPRGVAVSGGVVFVSGFGSSPDYPTTPGAFDTTYNGLSDLFVSSLSADLTTLNASTYLGGSVSDAGGWLDFDGTHVYLTGETRSADIPTSPTGYDKSLTGSRDVYVARLTADLSTLAGATYLGGSTGATTSEEAGTSIEAGASDVFVTGWTVTGNFPTTPGAYDTSLNGADYEDAFVARFSSDLSSLLGSTYLGGEDDDVAHGLALTGSHVFVVGETESLQFPASAGAFQEEEAGNGDAFCARLTRDLSTLDASTYFGGTGSEGARDVAVGAMGHPVLVGVTYSDDLPVPDDAHDTSHNSLPSVDDGFVASLSGNLGSQWADLGFGLAGTLGVPVLTGEGSLLAGAPVRVTLTGALPSKPAYLMAGVQRVDIFPFYGGTLVPAFASPFGLLLEFATDATGGIDIPTTWPPGLPPQAKIYLQYWIVDPGAPVGLAASNALEGTVP